MKLLFDADVIAYRSAFSVGDLATRQELADKIDDYYRYVWDRIDPFAETWEYTSYLTGKGNFRHSINKSYKANRKDVPKPALLLEARQYILDNYNGVVSEGEEADDMIATEATRLGRGNCIIISVDKDFLTVPVTVYNPGRDQWTEYSELEALKFFYGQILTGDTADNVIGIKGIGPKKSEKLLADCQNEKELYEAVLKAYDGDREKVVNNGQLLWLRRYDGEIWFPKI